MGTTTSRDGWCLRRIRDEPGDERGEHRAGHNLAKNLKEGNETAADKVQGRTTTTQVPKRYHPRPLRIERSLVPRLLARPHAPSFPSILTPTRTYTYLASPSTHILSPPTRRGTSRTKQPASQPTLQSQGHTRSRRECGCEVRSSSFWSSCRVPGRGSDAFRGELELGGPIAQL